MSDIATLGIAVDATGVGPAVQQLDALTAAGTRAEDAASKVTTATDKVSRSAKDAAAEIQRQTQAMQGAATATTSASVASQSASTAIAKQATATDALDREIEKLILSSNKQVNAQAQIGRAQAALNEGVAAGVISQATAATTMDALTKKYLAAAEGAGHASVSTSFVTREVRALGDELAAGRWKQFDDTLLNLESRILGIGTARLSTTTGIAAVAVAIGLLVARSEEQARAVLTIQTGFAAVGNAGLLSASQIKAYIGTIALLPGVSRDAATKTVTELSRVPYITGPLFDEVSKHIGDFAALLGTDVPKATGILAKAMEDPGRAADQLDKQLNLLTVDQRLLIQSYVEHGDRAGALAVLLQALEDRSRGLSEQGLTPMQKATEQVGIAWAKFVDALGDSTAIASVVTAIAAVIGTLATFIDKVGRTRQAVKDFYAEAAHSVISASDQSEIGSADLYSPDRPASAQRGASAPAHSFRASANYGEASVTDFSAASTVSAMGSGQSESDRAALDATKQYIDRTDKAKTLIEYENKLKDIYARQTDELKNATGEQAKQIGLARDETKEHIDGVQKRIEALQKVPQGRSGIEPLGLNVDSAALDAEIKKNDALARAEKAMLDDQQKARDFYHKMGVTSTEKYNADTRAANDAYLAQEVAFFDKDIAAAEKRQKELEAIVPASKGQSDQLQTALIKNQEKIDELKAKELALTQQITSENARRAEFAPYIKAQEDFNRSLKETQETTASVAEAEQRANLEVQLGLKSRSEGAQAVLEARSAAIGQLQQELAVMVAIHAQSQLDHASDQYIAQAKAIDQVNVKLLQMQAALDPIGQKLNQTFNSDLVNFFDKFGSGGIKTFKDLKTAALDFFGSLASSVAHEANQKLGDSILQSLGAKANSATGTSGGLGGVVSSWLGLGPKSGSPTTTPTGNTSAGLSQAPFDIVGPVSGGADSSTGAGLDSFTKSLSAADSGLNSFTTSGVGGATKGFDSYLEKLVFGTTAETSSTTASTSATSALTALTSAAYQAATALSSVGGGGGGGGSSLGGIGNLFGGSDAASAGTGLAADGELEALGSASEGIMFLHGGGIVGRDFAFKRQVDPSVFDGAPRMHSGGMAGLAGYEMPAILQKGEEVLTANDPRHRNNGGRGRSSGGMSVVQNFTVQPTESRSSQAQIAAQASAGLNAARARYN